MQSPRKREETRWKNYMTKKNVVPSSCYVSPTHSVHSRGGGIIFSSTPNWETSPEYHTLSRPCLLLFSHVLRWNSRSRRVIYIFFYFRCRYMTRNTERLWEFISTSQQSRWEAEDLHNEEHLSRIYTRILWYFVCFFSAGGFPLCPDWFAAAPFLFRPYIVYIRTFFHLGEDGKRRGGVFARQRACKGSISPQHDCLVIPLPPLLLLLQVAMRNLWSDELPGGKPARGSPAIRTLYLRL
jgi:hypothetical protein